MSTFSFPAQAPPNGSFRIRLRDAAVALFVALPTGLPLWLYENLLRPVLWVFFHLGKRPIVLANVALLDAPGPITMTRVSYHALSWSTSAVRGSEAHDMQTVESRAVSLDDFLAGLELAPRFIKIDVEGAELLVLRGAVKTLAVAQPLLFLEIHNWPSPGSEQVLRFLSQHDYCHEIVGTRGGEAFCLAAPATRELELREIRAAAGI